MLTPMDDLRHLHDGERLLCGMSLPGFVRVGWAAGAGLAGAVIVLPAAVASFLFLPLAGAIASGAFAVLIVAAMVWRSLRRSARATFRVTTERILLEFPDGAIGRTEKTMKWNQYQESFVGKAGFLHLLSGSRPLCIRFGGSDAPFTVAFPAVRHARDLKHYLDKVDSAERRKAVEEVRPFVDKPRGQRGE